VSDTALAQAGSQILGTQGGVPVTKAFLDAVTFTVSDAVQGAETRQDAITRSVPGYDPSSDRTSALADRLVDYPEEQRLDIIWLLGTSAHADHLTAAPRLQRGLHAKIATGEHTVTVQETFARLFNASDGSNFDKLFARGERSPIGKPDVTVLPVPGHLPPREDHGIVYIKIPGNTA